MNNLVEILNFLVSTSGQKHIKMILDTLDTLGSDFGPRVANMYASICHSVFIALLNKGFSTEQAITILTSIISKLNAKT